MSEDIISALDSFLSDDPVTTSLCADEVSTEVASLLSTEYFDSTVREPSKCPDPGCHASCTSTRGNETLVVKCDLDEEHEFELPIEERTYYDLSFNSILRLVASHIDETIVDSSIQSELPRYVAGETQNGIQIVLLASPADVRLTAAEIYMTAMQQDLPTLLVVPQEEVSKFVELQSLFATGSLVYTVPFSILNEKAEYVRKPVETLQDIRAMERRFIQKRTKENPHTVVKRVNSNPRYILSELNHMRLLRKQKEILQHSGTRLEKTGEVAFSHLFPTHVGTGGEDDRGKDLPDLLFYIPSLDESRYESILCVIDTKSGDEANFGREEARGKHDEYLARADRANVNARWRAHLFLILEFDGQQELEFYEKMSEFYGPQEFMVIVTADALALLLSAYLAATVSNELKLIHGDFRKAIYPFFHPEEFREANLGTIARPVGKEGSEYRDEYLQREDLLIVHREVVKHHLEQCLESPKNIARVFENYFAPMPTI